MVFKKLCLVVAIALLCSCNGQTLKNIESVEPKQFSEKLIAAANPQIIDVRTPQEFESEHIENAKNENWNDPNFDTNLKKYDKNKTVFVYCLSGGRSKKAAERLVILGFSDVIELNGGILKWNAQGFSKTASNASGITQEEYKKLLLSDKKILINFYADWCAPCKKMAPYLLKIQKELSDKVVIIRLNADENKTMVQKLKVDALPTLILYQNQKIKSRNTGYMSENELRKIIEL